MLRRKRKDSGPRPSPKGRAGGRLPDTTVERGPFTHAFCPDCGWEGPGRRARNVALEDAGLHALAGCGLPIAPEAPVDASLPVERREDPGGHVPSEL